MEVRLNSGVQAFGMSITTGANALNSANYFVNRIGSYIGGPVENRAISGTGFPSMVRQAYSYMPYGGRTKVGIIDGPFNDVMQTGPAALVTVVPSLDAMLTTAFVGYARYAAQTSPAVRRHGVWSALGTTFDGVSVSGRSGIASLTPVYTTDPTAWIEFDFFGPVVSLHGFMGETNGWRNIVIDIDGVEYATTDWESKARPGANKQPVAFTIDGLSNSTHVLRARPSGISAGQAVVIDCIQTPYIPDAAPVFLGSIPNIQNWGAPIVGTWADAQAVNERVKQVAERWSTYGYPVEFVDLTDFVISGRDFDTDGIHPTDRGQLNWALGYLSSMRIKP